MVRMANVRARNDTTFVCAVSCLVLSVRVCVCARAHAGGKGVYVEREGAAAGSLAAAPRSKDELVADIRERPTLVPE